MIEVNIRQIVDRILADSKESPRGRYYPTLVVGIGGMGMRVLRSLKKRLNQSRDPQVRLFGIDSDNTENALFPGLPQLQDSELAILDAAVAVNALEQARAGESTARHILGFLPDEYGGIKGLHQEVREKIQTQHGAGQFRRAGKLLFCSNVNAGANLQARLASLRQQLTGLATVVQQIREGVQVEPGTRVYVVCSIAGGTGAGSLLDCLALLRMNFPTQQDVITAVLILPGPLLTCKLHHPQIEKAQTYGNAIGVLRELQPFLVGEMGSHRFVFDSNTTFTLGSNPLVNDVFLVDHSTRNGRQPKDDFDLYRAASNFLYALVGSGVGASLAAGEINGQIGLDHKRGSPPRVYSSFGAAVVEYPVENLLEYSLRSALDKWLSRWLADAADHKTAEADVGNFLTAVTMEDLGKLRDALLPKTEVAGLPELGNPQWMRARKWEGDPKFFDAVDHQWKLFESDLQARARIVDDNAQRVLQKVLGALDAKVREWVCTGYNTTILRLAELHKRFEDLKKGNVEEQKKRASQSLERNKKEERLKTWVDYLDFPPGIDWRSRQKYLKCITAKMESELVDFLDPRVAWVLEQVIARVGELETRLTNLRMDIMTFVERNKECLGALEKLELDSPFIQPVVLPKEYRTWLNKYVLTIETCPAPASLALADIVKAALTPLEPRWQDVIKQLDIKAAAGENVTLKNAVVATDTAGQPLIELVPSAPSDLITGQKLVAGPFDENDSFVKNNFTQVGQREVVCLATGDKHRIVCVQTASGFGATHWKSFDTAQTFYRSREWLSHTFASPDALPQLRSTDSDQLAVLRDFGLGLVFELIAFRGANFYRNFLFYAPEQIHQYVLYKPETELSRGARELCRLGIIKCPGRAQTRPNRHYLLGNSLESAVTALGSPEQQSFREDLVALVNRLIVKLGEATTKELIEAYAEQELCKLIQKADPGTQRHTFLERISDALNAYAEQLV